MMNDEGRESDKVEGITNKEGEGNHKNGNAMYLILNFINPVNPIDTLTPWLPLIQELKVLHFNLEFVAWIFDETLVTHKP